MTNVSHWIGPQPNDPKPIIYFSGITPSAQITEPAFFKRTHAMFRCTSFNYCSEHGNNYMKRFKEAMDFQWTKNVRIFLDSGAHSFHEKTYTKSHRHARALKNKRSVLTLKQTRTEYLESVKNYLQHYIEYIQECGTKFDFYVTLDYAISCPVVFDITQQMYKAGVAPIPVYHGDQGLDWLQRYVDLGHKFIGIGWNPLVETYRRRAKYYDQVFNFATKRGIYLHGFACTGQLAFAYPWWSVDSTTWLRAAACGNILYPVERGSSTLIRTISLSRKLPKDMQDRDLHKYVEDSGFSLQALHEKISERAIYNVKVFQDLSMRKRTMPVRRALF